jgi:hypothetical protein
VSVGIAIAGCVIVAIVMAVAFLAMFGNPPSPLDDDG